MSSEVLLGHGKVAKPKVLDSIRVSKATGSGNFQKVEPLVEDRAGLSSKEPEQGVCTI